MSIEQPLAVYGPIHGNEWGADVVDALKANPGLGIPAKIGHPAALAAGVRYLGIAEIGGLMPGDSTSPDPDIRAAGELHNWLVATKPWAAVGLHSNTGQFAGNRYLGVGSRTRASNLAIGQLAGHDTIAINADYPLYIQHPEVIEIEEAVCSAQNADRLTREWLSLFANIRDNSQSGMSALYRPDQFRVFYNAGYLSLVYDNGSPNELILDNLPALEAVVTPEERFAPLQLPEPLIRALGLGGLELLLGTWNYRNMSTPVPEYGTTATGAVRRTCFGSIWLQGSAAVPTGNGDELVFEHPAIDLSYLG